jgi:hypothetical protein
MTLCVKGTILVSEHCTYGHHGIMSRFQEAQKLEGFGAPVGKYYGASLGKRGDHQMISHSRSCPDQFEDRILHLVG